LLGQLLAAPAGPTDAWVHDVAAVPLWSDPATATAEQWLPWAVAAAAESVASASPLRGDAGEYERQRDEDCERLYEGDSEVCRKVRTRQCWASAAERLAACLADKDIPELDTDSHWAPPLPFDIPRPRAIPPFPLPGGGGGGPVPPYRIKPRIPRL
jgi:hypothetical protein